MSKKPYGSGSTSLADFKQLALLGEGAYSAVYKVLRYADREIYALKKVKLPSLSDKEKQNALNEVRLLASVRHENIIDYKEAFFDEKTRCLCIVTDFADAGDLFQQIVKCQKERSHLREVDVWRYLCGMCYGLKALHEMRILHRDLKCANVFLCAHPNGTTVKLGDFNVSKVAKRGLCMTQTGTPYYASPEVWRDMPYDAKSDMWSLGCVLYEMVALRPPFRAEDMEGLYRKVLRGQYPRIPPHYSHDLSEVISVLLQVNPRHRPSVEQLLQMPVLRRHLGTVDVPVDRPQDLLSTIKMPKNAIDISVCLPKPRYEHTPQGEDPLAKQQEAPQLNSVADSGYDAIRRVSERRGSVGRLPTTGVAPTMPLESSSVLPMRQEPVGASEVRQQEHVRTRDDRHDERRDDRNDELIDVYPGHRETASPANLGAGGAGGGGGGGGGGGRHGQGDLVHDSLDAYLQQHEAHTVKPRHAEPERLEPDGLREDRNTPDTVSATGRQQLDRSRGRGEAQQLAPQADYSRSLVRGQYGGYRKERDQRRPMANYARPQYALPSTPTQPPMSQSTAQPPKNPGATGNGGGLRLPRIFSKAS